MADKVDILVLGATGFTGGLITRYLTAHPQRSQFTLALGARSRQKLQKLAQDLGLPSSVTIVQVDVTKPEEVDTAVKGVRVVINTVGPYWRWGTPVVRSCVRNGVHYVDLTGETAWISQIIFELDYFATKTKTIIVPSCGFDSLPSDISAYLANKTLKSLGPTASGEYLSPAESLTSHDVKGGISGGTVASVVTALDIVPTHILQQTARPYAISPVIGVAPVLRLLYKLTIPGLKTLRGAAFVMATSNRAIVQRTFGLLAIRAHEKKNKETALMAYGPKFCYDEFMVTAGPVSAVVVAVTLVIGFGMLLLRPFRNLAVRLLPSGHGPSDEAMQKGYLKSTNITTAASDPSVKVKTVIKCKGDPGYLLTAVMISESALCLLLPPVSAGQKGNSSVLVKDNIHTLPALARDGGILTPMTAFGDELIQRLQETGRFEFSSSVIEDAGAKKQI